MLDLESIKCGLLHLCSLPLLYHVARATQCVFSSCCTCHCLLLIAILIFLFGKNPYHHFQITIVLITSLLPFCFLVHTYYANYLVIMCYYCLSVLLFIFITLITCFQLPRTGNQGSEQSSVNVLSAIPDLLRGTRYLVTCRQLLTLTLSSVYLKLTYLLPLTNYLFAFIVHLSMTM